MTVQIIRGNALALPLEPASVDLVVTSPPYFGLRSYQDGGEHYAGQLGAEPTPAEFVDALIRATAEMVRVLKPSGSIWVNLGDKYAQAEERSRNGNGNRTHGENFTSGSILRGPTVTLGRKDNGVPRKSLIGVPWRYALRCIDDLGLILRAEVIWSKPNGLPESVTDRVRRSHETWFHFTKEPRYFSAVDEVREGYAPGTADRYAYGFKQAAAVAAGQSSNGPTRADGGGPNSTNPLGKLPGSVWTDGGQGSSVARLVLESVSAGGISVDEALGILSAKWFNPACSARSAASIALYEQPGQSIHIAGSVDDEGHAPRHPLQSGVDPEIRGHSSASLPRGSSVWTIPTQPLQVPASLGVDHFAAFPMEWPRRIVKGWSAPGMTVLDPFGGTGTTALVAHALGRHGISVDMSADYCRLARWRTSDPGQLAAAMQVEKPDAVSPDQDSLLDLLGEAS